MDASSVRRRRSSTPRRRTSGCTAVEALASGTPVTAYGKGGATEIIDHVITVLLFPEQTPASLVAAIRALSHYRFDPTALRRSSEAFSDAAFERRFRSSSMILTGSSNGPRSTDRDTDGREGTPRATAASERRRNPRLCALFRAGDRGQGRRHVVPLGVDRDAIVPRSIETLDVDSLDVVEVAES